jgi:hypothetical protein
MRRFALPALLLAAAFAAGAPALAADAKDAPTATAAATDGPSVGDQIDQYLKTSPALTIPKDSALGVTPGDEPRKVHGVASVAIGTGGYRSGYVRSDFPVGKTGTLSIAVEETRANGRYGGPGYGGYGGRLGGPYQRQNLGVGLAFGGAAQPIGETRCRPAADDGTQRLDQVGMDSERLRPCRASGQIDAFRR